MSEDFFHFYKCSNNYSQTILIQKVGHNRPSVCGGERKMSVCKRVRERSVYGGKREMKVCERDESIGNKRERG